MSTLFDERERAAESLFAHDEETRFLVRRRGIEALAAWAGESIGLDPAGIAAYREKLVDALVAGTPEDRIVAAVQTDLERAGKPTLAGQVAAQLTQALAAARQAQIVTPAAPPARAPDPHEAWAERHPKPKPTSSLWHD